MPPATSLKRRGQAVEEAPKSGAGQRAFHAFSASSALTKGLEYV